MMYSAQEDGTETSLGLATYGLALTIVASMIGISALIKSSNADTEEEKAIDVYNNDLGLGLNSKSNHYFSIKVQPNGLSLGMTF